MGGRRQRSQRRRGTWISRFLRRCWTGAVVTRNQIASRGKRYSLRARSFTLSWQVCMPGKSMVKPPKPAPSSSISPANEISRGSTPSQSVELQGMQFHGQYHKRGAHLPRAELSSPFQSSKATPSVVLKECLQLLAQFASLLRLPLRDPPESATKGRGVIG